MRFWLKPPYELLTLILFRAFFAAGLLGTLWDLIGEVRRPKDPTFSYLSGLRIGLAMCIATLCLFSIVLWLTHKRDSKGHADFPGKP